MAAAGRRSASIRIVFNNFPQLIDGMPGAADQVVRETAEAIEATAKAMVPVASGELQGSINAHPAGPAHWQVEAGTDHALYVEYGTAKHGGPRPYMNPAAHQNEPRLADGMRKAVEGMA
jgi:HK97 gp10 family phage protein